MARIRTIRKVRRSSTVRPARSSFSGAESLTGTPDIPSTSVLVVAPTALRTLFVSRMVTFEGVTLAGVAETEPEALERTVKVRPDVAVVDMDVSGPLAGLGVARTIQKVSPKTGILIMVRTLEGIDLRAESRSFGSSWSYMWRAMIEDKQSTEAVLRSVGSGVHWVDPQLKRVLAKVWTIALQARDLERDSLREVVSSQDLNYVSSRSGTPTAGIQSVSVGEGGRGQLFKGYNGINRAS